MLPEATLHCTIIWWLKLMRLDGERRKNASRLTRTTTLRRRMKKQDTNYLFFSYNETKIGVKVTIRVIL
jgi:hypothetical protein